MKKVSLKLNRRSVPDKIEFAGIIVLQMTGIPYFKLPVPPLKDIFVANTALEAAYKKAQVGGSKDTEDMYAKEIVLDQLLTALGGYVEFIANQDPLNAEAIILSAGMSVKGRGSVNIPILTASQGIKSTTVKLRRKSEGPRVAYKWQYSKDPFSDTSWVDAGESTVATFEINDLEPLKRYWFRTAVIKGTIREMFSAPVTFVIS